MNKESLKTLVKQYFGLVEKQEEVVAAKFEEIKLIFSGFEKMKDKNKV
jgi:hypothetical protein